MLEIPPADEGSITGTIMNCWQEALEDVGPAGVDKGKGGKYLITPPGFTDKVPDGYLHLPSNNFQGYALLRSILKSRSDADIAKAVSVRQTDQALPAVPGSQARRRRLSSMPWMWCSTASSRTTSASSSRSIASCRRNHGSNGIAR